MNKDSGTEKCEHIYGYCVGVGYDSWLWDGCERDELDVDEFFNFCPMCGCTLRAEARVANGAIDAAHEGMK